MPILILSKVAFNFHPIAVVFFEKRTIGWTIKVVMGAKSIEFFFNTEQAPTADDAKHFIVEASKIK